MFFTTQTSIEYVIKKTIKNWEKNNILVLIADPGQNFTQLNVKFSTELISQGIYA